jgi:tetratricopeptide (TPR) repeat protein
LPRSPPPSPSAIPRPAPANPLAPTIEQWRQRAAAHGKSGDLANAEIDWHVLTLLAPEEPGYRQELAATRAAIRRDVDENLKAARAAVQANDSDRATTAYLRVLALEPDNGEAARALRDLDRRRTARGQADRVASARSADRAAAAGSPPPASRVPRPAATEQSNGNAAYDLEQRLEMFNAGDNAGGLRELQAWVAAHPADRAGRQRVGTVVFDRAAELEAHGNREQALTLYEAAIALRGDAPAAWNTRVQTVRRTLSNEYYDRGTRIERTDLDAAVKALETSVRYDATNIKASARLEQARAAQARLKQIERAPAK